MERVVLHVTARACARDEDRDYSVCNRVVLVSDELLHFPVSNHTEVLPSLLLLRTSLKMLNSSKMPSFFTVAFVIGKLLNLTLLG